MTILWFLVPMAILLGLFFVVSFLIGVRRGQFDDLETPALRILIDDNDKERDR